jgi:predicted N-acetyltransferase YhbS
MPLLRLREKYLNKQITRAGDWITSNASRVAEDNEAVVGRIMFSPVSLSGHAGLKISGVVTAVVRKYK